MTLLTVDSIVNLALGLLLIWFPRRLIEALGIPDAPSAFYPSVLGAVLFGIGLALWLERSNDRSQTSGLGLVGALTINLCGGIVLALWLIFGQLALPVRGVVGLWALVLFLVGISVLELNARTVPSRPHPSGRV